MQTHDDVIKWKHFPRYWPFVRGIHRPPMNSHKGQWRWSFMFSLICARINRWVNNREAGDLRRYRVHYDVIVMLIWFALKEIQLVSIILCSRWCFSSPRLTVLPLSITPKRGMILHYHLYTPTTWLTLCRRHFQMNFLGWGLLHFN